MKPASFALAAAAALVVSTTACEGLKEAMTAHVNTAARAGSQELSVDRLGKLLSEATVPPRKDVASAIANAWVDYQLLGAAAASGDTVVSTKEMDAALWAPIATLKARKYYELVSKNWGGNDSLAAHQMYDNGDILAASHILLLTKGAPEQVKTSQKAKIDALHGQVNASNFATLAKNNSQDTQSAVRGGSLGLFRKGQMVPPFEKALLALKPGEISPVIETDFGYHIIRRPTFDEVRGDVTKAAQGRSVQVAESAFVSKLQQNAKMDVKSNAAATARVVLADPDAHRKDKSTLATSTAGDFTAAELAKWIETFPPMVQAQQKTQLQTAPDSIVVMFVKNFVTNDLVLHAADSAKVGPTPEELQQLRASFAQARSVAWAQLGVDPKTLADSAKNPADRATFAAKHIEAYMDRLVGGQAQFVQVPEPVARVLRDKADASVNSAGVDRAVERAVKDHATADSTRRASQPSTAVPMPMGGPQAGPQGTPQEAPQGARQDQQPAPAPATPPTSKP